LAAGSSALSFAISASSFALASELAISRTRSGPRTPTLAPFSGGAPAWGEGASGRSVVSYQFVSPEFFGVFGIDLVRGRGFTDSERNPNEGVAVVSETVARELWPGADPLGQILRVEPDPTIVQLEPDPSAQQAQSDDPMLLARTAVVVGIAADVAGFRIGGMRIGGSGVYMPISAGATDTVLIARMNGDIERARRELVDRLVAIDPNMAEVSTLQALANMNAYIFGTSFWLTLVLGVLALLLTLSGLYSVLSYLVEQRTREIGVRMALGASSRSIGGLVLLQSARPVGIGVLLGATLTVGLAAVLLATPAAEQIGSAVRLFDPVAYAASLCCVVAVCAGAALIPALRAGRVNPLAALRQD
jgi:ABC-type antimicrobial peptide transport system permease subunit